VAETLVPQRDVAVIVVAVKVAPPYAVAGSAPPPAAVKALAARPSKYKEFVDDVAEETVFGRL
jgi:hypothetical protein